MELELELEQEPEQPSVVVVMGVSGSGKSTVGALLAGLLDVPYADADDFHPPANVAKMSAGTPLDDADRAPWLDAVGAWARDHAGTGGGVVTCSALKRAYRDRLRAAAAPGLLFFVHLSGDRELIARRMGARTDHFMPLALLDSQLATLQPLAGDEHGAVVDVDAPSGEIAARAADTVRRVRRVPRLAGD